MGCAPGGRLAAVVHAGGRAERLTWIGGLWRRGLTGCHDVARHGEGLMRIAVLGFGGAVIGQGSDGLLLPVIGRGDVRCPGAGAWPCRRRAQSGGAGRRELSGPFARRILRSVEPGSHGGQSNDHGAVAAGCAAHAEG